ncbi:MAG: restriction endonuclease subunit S, partial [Victivallaceae bacterium]|nr:restriction endonuclease subunit S [Victivallaceae bacterium]
MKDLGQFSGGKTPSTTEKAFWGNDVLWVTSKDMKTKYISDTQLHLSKQGGKELQLLGQDSLLMVTRSGILRRIFPLAITKRECTINQDLKALSLYISNLVEYVFAVLSAYETRILNEFKKSGTTVESIIWEKFIEIPIPIPPENEARRIVKCVTQALAVVDTLNANAASLDDLVKLARQKVLALAINGKLVPQNPNDEPALELLKKIKAEKEALVKAGKIKRDKHESFIF